MPNKRSATCYSIQKNFQILEDDLSNDNNLSGLRNNNTPILKPSLKKIQKEALNKNTQSQSADEDECHYFSCEEEDDEFFDFKSSLILDNHLNDQASTIPHENLNNHVVKQNFMQRILNWFRALIHYFQKSWFSKKLNDNDPVANTPLSMNGCDNSSKEVSTYKNTTDRTTISNLNKSTFLVPHRSYANAFYQTAKKKDCHPTQTIRCSLNK